MSGMERCIRLRYLVCVCWWLGWTSVVSAAQLNLSSTPLFLNFNVQSNLLFLIDDSGSQNWEVITGDFNNDGRFTGTQLDGSSPPGSGRVRHRDNDDDGIVDCGFGSRRGQNPNGYSYGVEFRSNTDRSPTRNNCNTADDAEWRFRSHTFNSIYFNPNQVYFPWRGLDAGGNPFQPMNIQAAKDNPYDPSSPTLDLTRHNSHGDRSITSDRDGDGQPDGFRYYTWTDVNANGLFDDGEETVHFIKNEPRAVQENFANWFSYYRKREYIVKAVYGELLANMTNFRVGLVTLHDNTNGINRGVNRVNTPLQSIDFDANAPTRPNTDPARGNRRALLDALYSFRASGGTPLRATLERTGDYLQDVDPRNLFRRSNAYLPEAEGGACQQSFVILMTDGFENGALPAVGNADADNAPINPQFDGGPYADSYPNTLADVAMHYYERDLNGSLSDLVPTNQFDRARHQHMVTYTITFGGLQGSLTSDPTPTTNGTTFWPDPEARDQFRIDDLRHAAFNGRGLFLQANDAFSLADALRRALNNIAQRTSSAAAVALNTGALNTTSRLFQARFDSGTWSGQLLSIKLDPLTGAPLQTPENIIDSGALLDTLLQENNYNTNVRTILTYKPSTARGIPFQWPLLDTAQQRALDTDSRGSVDNLGQDRLNFIRGSNAAEGPRPPVGRGRDFRERPHRLGDLVNSDPYFVGPPGLPDHVDPSGAYSRFRDAPAQRDRMRMVIVGGNDGMLHIFNANAPFDPQTTQGDPRAGHEVLAYVPNAVLPNTVDLTSPTYRHRYYVDGSPTAGDVFLSARGWRTVVVGGLRSGGQGYFALDITDPATFSEDPASAQQIVLWEFTDADDPDLGFTHSQPSLVRMRDGHWYAVFGNGYNNSMADRNVSPTGHAMLFLVRLDGPGADGRWDEDIDYIKIDTGRGDLVTPNGLATPAVVDVNGDLTADYIVAGDLFGNLWRLDVRGTTPSAWKQPANLTLIFQTDPAGMTQPITSRPEVGPLPHGSTGFAVYIGTGKYLEVTDNSPTGPSQSFYAIQVVDDPALTYPVQRSELLPQRVMEEVTITDAEGAQRRARITTNELLQPEHRGFFLDLPASGERQVSDSVLRNGRILFTTLVPSDQPCSFGGTSFTMVLDAQDGGRPESPFFDLNADRQFGAPDVAPTSGVPISGLGSTVGIIVGTPTPRPSGATDTLYASGASGDLQGEDTDPGPGAVGRQAWRRITQ